MANTEGFHALGLHMHQPPGNLQLLIDSNEWEARQIILCYERPARYARQYSDVARFMVGFSGILLEQLTDPKLIDRYRHILDIPQALAAYRDCPNIEILGMGYYHPIFPLIPKEDWEAQLLRGREIARRVFGREPVGFWPPEMAFSMEMIPALVKAGYRYVVVDHVHVKPKDPSKAPQDLRFHPQIARHDGHEIAIIPRDRDLSNAQESGCDPSWFAGEAEGRVTGSRRPCVLTTWSDGENGGWFRQTDEGSGFWGHYFAPYMERVRAGEMPVRPITLSQALDTDPPKTEVDVQTGAWNIGTTDGSTFVQWAGSDAQRQALEAVWGLSRRYRRAAGQAKGRRGVESKLLEVQELLLGAETSCHFFWGDAWLPKVYDYTGRATGLLEEIERAG